MMRILIVGCGAVGQVYGLALQEAGVSLGLLDRPAVAKKLTRALEQGGLPLYAVSRKHRDDPIPYRLDRYQVIVDLAEARQFKPDQIWFTTPSQAYYTDWFQNFLQQVPSRRVVCFTPEGSRPEFLTRKMGERVIFAGTTFMAWQGDLAGNSAKEGVYYWRPPLGIPLVGNREACLEVAQALKKAGFRVMLGKPGSRSQASMTAAMTAFVAGLELAGWSLQAYRRSPWLKSAAGACQEAVLSQLPGHGAFQRALLGIPLLSAVFRLVASLLPVLFPFDVEKYLKFHYTKTRAQTILLLNLFMQDGLAGGVPVTHIQGLLGALQAAG
jgi:ketopantoate reductase